MTFARHDAGPRGTAIENDSLSTLSVMRSRPADTNFYACSSRQRNRLHDVIVRSSRWDTGWHWRIAIQPRPSMPMRPRNGWRSMRLRQTRIQKLRCQPRLLARSGCRQRPGRRRRLPAKPIVPAAISI